MTDIRDVLREMREKAAEPAGYGEYPITSDDVHQWADAIEQAMRKPVAEVAGFSYDFGEHAYMSVRSIRGYERLPPGTKLFAFPPDAARVIELEVEHSKLLTGEIGRLREALELMLQRYGYDTCEYVQKSRAAFNTEE